MFRMPMIIIKKSFNQCSSLLQLPYTQQDYKWPTSLVLFQIHLVSIYESHDMIELAYI